MEQFDEPITIELRTEREVLVTMFGLGVGASQLEMTRNPAGARAALNIQIRIAKADTETVLESVSGYSNGVIVGSEGMMSVPAAIASLADEDEVDPDEFNEGSL